MARSLLATGANLDLGLAQINSSNLTWLGLTVEQAFDPCRNLAAAATVLRAGYQLSGPTAEDAQTALRVALSRYNTGDASRGFRNGYVGRVENAAVTLRLSAPPSSALPTMPITPTPLQPSPPPTPAPAWDVFGRPESKLIVFSTFPER